MMRVNSEPLILAECVDLISFDDVSNIFTRGGLSCTRDQYVKSVLVTICRVYGEMEYKMVKNNVRSAVNKSALYSVLKLQL